MFNNINSALDWLQNKKKKTKREDLKRITTLAELLNVKNNNFKIIHIAGTNGKGSTAMYFTNMLMDLGFKVGSFTSPYIIKFNERITINNEYISDMDLLKLINNIYPIICDYEVKNDDLVPFFEILVLIAFQYFKQNQINYLVLECGLGGRLDATNFVIPNLSIITSIGYDHQNSLGEDILDIAYHKAGIIKENGVCFTISNPLTNQYVLAEAKLLKSKLFVLDDVSLTAKEDRGTNFIYNGFNFHTPLYGLYQANNAALMIAGIKYLFPDLDYNIINKSLQKAFIPARFEKINNYILDGAHNISAIKELVRTLKELRITNIICIYTSLKDKKYPEIIPILDEIIESYIFPTFNDARSVEAKEFSKYTNKKYQVVDSLEEAFNLVNTKPCLITGSLHFVSECRKLLID